MHPLQCRIAEDRGVSGHGCWRKCFSGPSVTYCNGGQPSHPSRVQTEMISSPLKWRPLWEPSGIFSPGNTDLSFLSALTIAWEKEYCSFIPIAGQFTVCMWVFLGRHHQGTWKDDHGFQLNRHKLPFLPLVSSWLKCPQHWLCLPGLNFLMYMGIGMPTSQCKPLSLLARGLHWIKCVQCLAHGLAHSRYPINGNSSFFLSLSSLEGRAKPYFSLRYSRTLSRAWQRVSAQCLFSEWMHECRAHTMLPSNPSHQASWRPEYSLPLQTEIQSVIE